MKLFRMMASNNGREEKKTQPRDSNDIILWPFNG